MQCMSLAFIYVCDANLRLQKDILLQPYSHDIDIMGILLF